MQPLTTLQPAFPIPARQSGRLDRVRQDSLVSISTAPIFPESRRHARRHPPEFYGFRRDERSGPSINPASFSGIWTGTVTPTISGDHVFKVSSGGNVQLFVNNAVRSLMILLLLVRLIRQSPLLRPLCQYPGKSICKLGFL